MEEANFLPPVSRRATFPGVSIDKLPDFLLAKIFSYLPLKDRYLLCLVSSKWAVASGTSWKDVSFLNLNSLPRAMLNTILGLCPKVKTIVANDRFVLLEQKAELAINEHVRTLKLRQTRFTVSEPLRNAAVGVLREEALQLFGHCLLKRFPNLTELLLQNVSGLVWERRDDKLYPFFPNVWCWLTLRVPDTMVTTLRRMVIMNSPYVTGITIDESLASLSNLECLCLEGVRRSLNVAAWNLPQLRELCVVNRGDFVTEFSDLSEGIAAGKFPKLEVFLYSASDNIPAKSVAKLITAKLPFRILLVAGKDSRMQHEGRLRTAREKGLAPAARDSPLTMPARALHGGSVVKGEPSKPLQIFVGGDITKYLRFTLPPSDVANFWRIDRPMPEYLAQQEVAEVFKDVCTAEMITEGPENGLLPWGYPDNMNLFYSTSPLLFA